LIEAIASFDDGDEGHEELLPLILTQQASLAPAPTGGYLGGGINKRIGTGFGLSQNRWMESMIRTG
jgi:hypothetical protein